VVTLDPLAYTPPAMGTAAPLSGDGAESLALDSEDQEDIGVLWLRGEGPPIQVRQLVAQVVEGLVVLRVVPEEHGFGTSDAFR